jgi:Asp-tRNA(Asn)/Glu-tRNA(Gln) amidotransferase C subunit
LAEKGELSKETFLQIAEASGLDVSDSQHMEELYRFVQGILPNMKVLREMDLSEVEPAAIYAPPRE